MRGLPSTVWVSFSNARTLSFRRALATVLSKRLACCALTFLRSSSASSERSTRAYQRLALRMPAKPRIASRYWRAESRSIPRRCLALKPRSRPATAMLAASRLTSHSHGPGSVSSKSLRSKMRSRSGEAKPPKFDRCASPHSCTRIPELGPLARSEAITYAAPR